MEDFDFDSNADSDGDDAAGMREHFNREDAVASVDIPGIMGGRRITYYRNGDFVAYCCEEGHVNCKKSRTANAGARPQQGRPLGFLMSWLTLGDEYDGKTAHVHLHRTPKFRERQRARETLMNLPGADLLAAFERERRDDEGEEPRRCP